MARLALVALLVSSCGVAASRPPVSSVVGAGTTTPAPTPTSLVGGGGASAVTVAPPAGVGYGHTPNLAALRRCESGGRYDTDTGNGQYGAYQFSTGTWRSVGGVGNPAVAAPAEQDMRALALYHRRGRSPWPYCGRFL